MYPRFLAFIPSSPLLFLKKSNIGNSKKESGIKNQESEKLLERRLEVAENFAETEIFRDTESGPFSQVEIDEESEEDNPRKTEEKCRERIPTDEIVSDNRDDECFDSQDEGHPAAFFNLGRNELLSECDHDEEWENRNRSEAGALLIAAQDENAENSKRNDREGDGDAGEIQQTKRLQGQAGDHSDQDDAHENRDAVLDTVGIESEEREGDDRRGVDAERLDADDLAEERHESGDDGQHEKKRDRLYRNALFYEKCDERVVGHIFMKGIGIRVQGIVIE